MADKKNASAKTVNAGWHNQLPDYVDLSDGKEHTVRFKDDGTETKIPGSKSELNVNFLVLEKVGDEWEPTSITLAAKRALRELKGIQENSGSLVDRVFTIQRTGTQYETRYIIKEVA